MDGPICAPSQMQTFGEVFSTETAMFHTAAAAKYGLSITDMKTISILMQEGPMTAGQIAQRLNLTTGAITNVIDRLEHRKLAKRQPDPKDRRKVIVSVNPKQLKSAENVYLSMGTAFEQLLDTYTTQELEFLVKFYESTIEMTKREILKLDEKK